MSEETAKRRGRPPRNLDDAFPTGQRQLDRRRRRAKFDGGRYKLSTPRIPGYECRWVNDINNRIHEFTVMNDWDFVTAEEIGHQVGDAGTTGNQEVGSRVSRIVGTTDSGQPMKAYLLKIKKEFFDEDRKEKGERADRIEAELKRGTLNKVEHQYGRVEIRRA